MARPPHVDLDVLLVQYRVDLAALESAPDRLTLREWTERVLQMPPRPCTLCGELSLTCLPVATPHGRRWVDLCRDHALQSWTRRPRLTVASLEP